MIFKSLVAVAAAITIAGTPMLVCAQTLSSPVPVVVTNVQVYGPKSVGNGESILAGRLDLDFHVTGSLPVTDVVFTVGNETESEFQTYDVRGTFAPNVAIRRSLINPSYDPNLTVTVVRVTFADGSPWFQ